MNEKTEQLVRELAEKLGTTVNHLWGVLLRQAPITAATEIAVAAIMAVILWLAYRLVRAKTTTPQPSESGRYPSAEWEDEGAFIAWLLLGIYGFVVVIQTCCAVTTAITATLNPEYWALQQLLP